MSEKDKKLLLRLLIVAVVIVLGVCIFNMTKKQTSVGEMQWLMVPSGDVYFVRDGNEPADNYSDIWYDEWAKLYYIDWEKGGRTYVTPEGKPVEMTGEYEYLKNLPIPASGIGENGEYYDYYIYADGTEAFSQRFRYAHPFEGDYAIVQNGDEKNGVINKEGMPVYSAEFVREDLNYLDGSLFAEQRRNDCKIVDISTGKTLRILKDTEFYNRFNEGYIFVDRKKNAAI